MAKIDRTAHPRPSRDDGHYVPSSPSQRVATVREIAAFDQNLMNLESVMQIFSAQDVKDAARALLDTLKKLEVRPVTAVVFGSSSDGELLEEMSRMGTPMVSKNKLSSSALANICNGRKVISEFVAGMCDGEFEERVAIWIPFETGGARVDGKAEGLLYTEWESDNSPTATVRIMENLEGLVRLCAPHFEALGHRTRSSNIFRGYAHSIAAIIAAKDTYTAGHSERVTRYSVAMARLLKLDRETSNNLLISALCHDVGKVAISDAVLRKPGLLGADEMEEMKQHPLIGSKIVSCFPLSGPILSGIRHHHERLDGTGYPDGLVGDQISLFARVIGIVDAFDAIVSGRSYSGFSTEEQAVEILCKMPDSFDSDLLRIFASGVGNGLITLRTETRHGGAEEMTETKIGKIC